MTIDTQKLRDALAPLPRIAWGRSKATVVIPETDDFAGKCLSIDGLSKQYARNLATYIAAANPEDVSALLDHIDAQAAEIDRLRNVLLEIARTEPLPGLPGWTHWRAQAIAALSGEGK